MYELLKTDSVVKYLNTYSITKNIWLKVFKCFLFFIQVQYLNNI